MCGKICPSMQRLLAIFLVFACGSVAAQVSTKKDCDGPKEIVEQVWKLATQGDLLTEEGWDKLARGFFVYPPPAIASKVRPLRPQGGRAIHVVSNDWGVVGCTMGNNTAKVAVEYYDAGLIDETLRYTPGVEPPPMGKSGMLFTLVFAPGHWETYKTVGDTLEVAEVKTASPAWRIESPQGPVWATVNAALRYVLEIQESTENIETKKKTNAIISKLLHFHSK